MVSIPSLVIPILVSAVIVFVASSIIHMVLPYHRSDLRKLAKEDDVLAALRRLSGPPGDYAAPHAASPAGMKDPAFIEKMHAGPVVLMTVSPGGPPAMGRSLALWFLYSIVMGVFAAYSLALLQNSIWYRRNWGATAKSMFDGLICALLTAGTFGWLWPA